MGQINRYHQVNHKKKWEAIFFGISKKKTKTEIIQDHQFVSYSQLEWESLKLNLER